MNPVISEIERTGLTVLPSGTSVPVKSHVGPEAGLIIRNAILDVRPRLACEVGLAFGVSSLYILGALAEVGQGRLIGMDPAQHDETWQGGGLHNIRRAGYSDRYDFHEKPSQIVLPGLVTTGTRIQFGFVDGWHTYDHTLVDFFYIDQMLDVGGIVVLDDVGYPSIRRLVHFVVTNRDYEIVGLDPIPGSPDWKNRAKQFARWLLEPIVRDDTSPGLVARSLKKRVDRARLIALRKRGDDSRRFDHFVAF